MEKAKITTVANIFSKLQIKYHKNAEIIENDTISFYI
jgi:hypothetical protein